MSAPMRVSRPLLIALTATLALTAASYGVRAWRVAEREAQLRDSAVSRTDPRPTNPTAAAVPVPTSAHAVPPAAAQGTSISAPAGLRPAMPAAHQDAMASRLTPPPVAADAPPPPPPPVVLPPPRFRVLGQYIDGGEARVIIAHDQNVVIARPGDALPDGFRLRAIRADAIVVVRLANHEHIDIPLGNP